MQFGCGRSGRLGARIPLYGPLHSVVSAEVAGEWLKALLELSTFTTATAAAIMEIARRTDDSSRDIEDAIREQAVSRLTVLGVAEETIQLLSKYVPPERADAVRSFGEPLPPGLQVVSSSNCLLSVPALHSSSSSYFETGVKRRFHEQPARRATSPHRAAEGTGRYSENGKHLSDSGEQRKDAAMAEDSARESSVFPGMSHAWRALRHRNFRLFFGGQSISLIGTWMTRVATSWLVYRLTGSAILLGTVGFAGQIPTFLLAPFAGVWVDRWNRRRVLLATQTLAMVQSLALAALTLSHRVNIHEILWLSVFQGVINAFDMPGRQAFLVQMVEDKNDLGNAIAINSSMVNVARLLGPALAGLLIAATNEGWCFLIDGVSYLAVLASLLMMRVQVAAMRRKGTSHAGATEGRLDVRLKVGPAAHDSAAVCAGEPDGHAVHRADAGVCVEGAARRATYAGLSDGSLGRGRTGVGACRWRRAGACAGLRR